MIKICGMTRPEDAEAAVRGGATAIGFVFWPESPRHVTPEVARRIVEALPPEVTPVGVFVNQPVPLMQEIAAAVGLRAIQLHGDESVSIANALDRPVLRSWHVDRVEGLDEWPVDTVLLLDAFDPIARGGTGRRVDWIRAAALARTRRVVLAGGLTPENVAEAVATVLPFGVDVSSGVEREPGIKDADKVRRFLAAARKGLGRDQGSGVGDQGVGIGDQRSGIRDQE